MTFRTASAVAAIVLGLGAPAAFAQSGAARDPSAVQDVRISQSLAHRGAAVADVQALRGFDSSAKGGNAEHGNFVVPNFGTTAGGPAY